MPYPTRPTGPRDSWEPTDCQTAKDALIRQLGDTQQRFQTRYDQFARLRDQVCQDARALRDSYTRDPASFSLACVLGMERLCELFGFLERLYAKQEYVLVAQIMAAIDLIDCLSADWLERWDEAGDLWNEYNSLTAELGNELGRAATLYAAAKQPCRAFYPLEPGTPFTGPPTISPWFDEGDLLMGIVYLPSPPPPVGPPPPGPVHAPATPTAGGCGCGGATP